MQDLYGVSPPPKLATEKAHAFQGPMEIVSSQEVAETPVKRKQKAMAGESGGKGRRGHGYGRGRKQGRGPLPLVRGAVVSAGVSLGEGCTSEVVRLEREATLHGGAQR